MQYPDMQDYSISPSLNSFVEQCMKDARFPKEARPAFDTKLIEALGSYKYNPSLCRAGQAFVVVKNLKQQAMTLGQRLGLTAGVLGGSQVRKYAKGILASFALDTDAVTEENKHIIASDLEPCGITIFDNYLAYTAGDKLFLCNLKDKHIREYTHPWFASLHSVDVSPDKTHLLVASTGFDTVYEVEIETGKIHWNWKAWEQTFSRSQLGHHVVFEDWHRARLHDSEVVQVSSPTNFMNAQGITYGLPSKFRAEHLNTARYFGEDKVLITFFHSGSCLIVNKATGAVENKLQGFANPHNFSATENGFSLADTRNGRYLQFDRELNLTGGLSLQSLHEEIRDEAAPEWLQNASYLPDGTLSLLDVHRRKIWLINEKKQEYRGISIPEEWALQELCLGNDELRDISQVNLETWPRERLFCAEVKHHVMTEEANLPPPFEPVRNRRRETQFWKGDAERVLADCDWDAVRRMSVKDFALWIANKLCIDVAFVTQEKRNHILERFKELTGYDYYDIDGFAASLLHAQAPLADEAHQQASYFPQRVLGVRRSLDCLLSAPAITDNGFGNLYTPFDPYGKTLEHVEQKVIAPLIVELGLSDPWSRRGLVLNESLMFEKHMWTKSVVYTLAIQTLAQVYGELDENYVELYQFAGPDILENSLKFAYLLDGKNGVYNASFLQRHLHITFMRADEESPEVRTLEKIYREALSGELFKQLDSDFPKDTAEYHWGMYWSIVDGSDWQSIYERHQNDVLGHVKQSINLMLEQGVSCPTLIIGDACQFHAFYLRGQHADAQHVPLYVMPYSRDNFSLKRDRELLENYSVRQVNVRPEFATNLDFPYKPRVILVNQSIAHTALPELLATINHIADDGSVIHLVLHPYGIKEKATQEKTANVLLTHIDCAKSAIRFLENRLSSEEFAQSVEGHISEIDDLNVRTSLLQFKMKILSCPENEKQVAYRTLYKELQETLIPKYHAFMERYKPLSGIPQDALDFEAGAYKFFNSFGFEVFAVTPLVHGDIHERNLVTLRVNGKTSTF